MKKDVNQRCSKKTGKGKEACLARARERRTAFNGKRELDAWRVDHAQSQGTKPLDIKKRVTPTALQSLYH
jgi:hypothetical protein